MKKLMIAMLMSSGCLICSTALAEQGLSPQENVLNQTAMFFQQHHLLKPTFFDFHKQENRITINQKASKDVLNHYAKLIDPLKIWLTVPDVDAAHFVRWDKLGPYEALYKKSLERQREAFDFNVTVLSDPNALERLDKVSGEFSLDRSKESWPTSTQDLHALWLKKLKIDMNNKQYHSKKSGPELIAELKAQYEESKQYINEKISNADEWSKESFEMAMQALTTADAHSGFIPSQDQSLSMGITGKLVGVGATLSKKNKALIIEGTLPGSPAREANLKSGDEITRVESSDGTVLDGPSILRESVSKIINNIRGPEGTSVMLWIKKANGATSSVTLTRKKIDVLGVNYREKTFDGRTIGIIDFPVFGENTGPAVRKAVAELNAKGIYGVVLNLTNNGGGLLDTAVDLGSFFINGLSENGKGNPIVCTKPSINGDDCKVDTSPGLAYEKGPVAILTNRLSASASEILAGAIQDYQRGFVFGSKTFGKGSVQSVVPMSKIPSVMPISDQLGEVKITTSRFYRPSGVSTQLVGVSPDIVFPSLSSNSLVGESHLEGHLEASGEVKKDFKPEHSPWAWTEDQLRVLEQAHQKRMKNSPYFSYVAAVNKNAQECPVDVERLNYQQFKGCKDKQADAEKKFLVDSGYGDKNSLDELSSDEQKVLLDQPEADESAAILADFMDLKSKESSAQQAMVR